MVEKSFRERVIAKTKAEPAPGKKTAGRRPGPIEDVRTERLVVRMHPDLFGVLTEKGKLYGVSRSQYVERILISYLNMQAGQATIDWTGRFAKDVGTIKVMRQSPAEQWAAFGRRNQAILGRTNAEIAAAAAGRWDDLDKD